MKSILIFSIMTLLPGGCGDSVESLAEEPERRNQILKACADMGPSSQDDKLCRMATRAQVEATRHSIKGGF